MTQGLGEAIALEVIALNAIALRSKSALTYNIYNPWEMPVRWFIIRNTINGFDLIRRRISTSEYGFTSYSLDNGEQSQHGF